MTKKSKAIVPHVEVIEARPIPDAREELRRFIEQTVAEMTSGQANTVFEPWFRNKLVADAIKRSQTVIEQQKWPRYFAKFGCLICAEGNVVKYDLCRICGSGERIAIEADIRAAVSYREIAGRYEVSKSSAWRHRKHMDRQDPPPKPVAPKAHVAIGMCEVCYRRTQSRLEAIIKEAEAERKPQSLPTDLSDKARSALRRAR